MGGDQEGALYLFRSVFHASQFLPHTHAGLASTAVARLWFQSGLGLPLDSELVLIILTPLLFVVLQSLSPFEFHWITILS
jgi:hypothetical protein